MLYAYVICMYDLYVTQAILEWRLATAMARVLPSEVPA